MKEFLRQIDPEVLALGCFLLGQWWNARQQLSSLRGQGRRIGGLAGRVAQLEGILRVAPPPPEEGHGG